MPPRRAMPRAPPRALFEPPSDADERRAPRHGHLSDDVELTSERAEAAADERCRCAAAADAADAAEAERRYEMSERYEPPPSASRRRRDAADFADEAERESCRAERRRTPRPRLCRAPPRRRRDDAEMPSRRRATPLHFISLPPPPSAAAAATMSAMMPSEMSADADPQRHLMTCADIMPRAPAELTPLSRRDAAEPTLMMR